MRDDFELTGIRHKNRDCGTDRYSQKTRLRELSKTLLHGLPETSRSQQELLPIRDSQKQVFLARRARNFSGGPSVISREPGKIELVAEPSSTVPEHQWYVQEFGGGVMVLDPKIGRVFIAAKQLPDAED